MINVRDNAQENGIHYFKKTYHYKKKFQVKNNNYNDKKNHFRIS